MKFLNKLCLVVITLLLVSTLGCDNKTENAIDFGSFKEGQYTNTFFNLRVSIPESWYVMDDEARIALMQAGKKIVAGDDENLKATLDASDLQNINLITSYEKAPGTPTSSNPSFILIAESIKHAPGIKRGSDYHFHTKKMLSSSALNVAFPRDVYEETIDGKTFDVFEMMIKVGELTSFQKQYAAIIDQQALLIIVTYQDDEGLSKLEQIMQTIKFN